MSVMGRKNSEKPKVGIGVIIVNEDSHILIGKRKGGHAPYHSIPGGHLEAGESFEEAAIREIKEETGITIHNPRVICITNNLETYLNEGKHYISIALVADGFDGSPVVMEPDKCEGWQWVDPTRLPQPHFDASEMSVSCYLNGVFYQSR